MTELLPGLVLYLAVAASVTAVAYARDMTPEDPDVPADPDPDAPPEPDA